MARRTLTFLAAAAAAVALLGLSAAATGAATTAAKASHKRTYDGLFRRKVSKGNKRWAKRVARCESGGDPNAVGGGGAYRGAFQFMRSTWRAAPRSPGGDPIDYSYKTQAFVAVRLKTRAGSSPWPSCP